MLNFSELMSFCCPLESKAEIDKIDDTAIDFRRNNNHQIEHLSGAPTTKANRIEPNVQMALSQHLMKKLLNVYDDIKSAESFTAKEKNQLNSILILLKEEVKNKNLTKQKKQSKNRFHLHLLVPKLKLYQRKERKMNNSMITS